MTITGEGTKAPTIYDVAVAAGVSKSLVSLVINGGGNVSPAKHEAVLKAIKDLGYRPSRFAQQLASSHTRSIGVVITDYTNLSYLGFLKGLREIFDEAGYQVFISDLHRSPNLDEDPVDAFVSLKVDGIVLATEAEGLHTQNLDIPVVMIGRRETTAPGADMVYNDDEEGTRLVVEHLHSLGHRRIAHLTGAGGVAKNRLEAYLKVMRQLGLTPMVFGEKLPTTEIGGFEGAKQLLNSGFEATAIFAANDYMAAGAWSALREAGLSVPEDISVAGYDDSPIASPYMLKLTTVDEKGLAVGRKAARLLLAKIGGMTASKPRHELIQPTLVVRASTAKPRN